MSIPQMLERLREKFGDQRPSIYGCLQFGIDLERERIIKLLENQMTELEPLIAQWSEPAFQRWKELEIAIALIKGENK